MIKKVKSIEELIFKNQRRYKLKEKVIKNIIGVDTETHEGYSFLISDSLRNTIEVNSIFNLLSFLTSYRFRKSYNFFFNIRFDFQAIIKHLLKIDAELFKELYFNNRCNIGDYSLYFIPKKLFSIRYNDNSYRFYDIAQFYEGLSLDKASKLYLNSKKIDIGVDKSNIYEEYLNNPHKIIKYCAYDAELTKGLAEYIYNTVLEDFNFNPKSFISKADISGQYFRNNCFIPQINTLWKEKNDIFKYALNNYHGGRFELLQKGYFDYCIEYDINSAYPYEIAQLIDINQGEWYFVKEFEDKATYGFYKCYVKYLDPYLSPFIMALNPSIKYNPVGEFEIYLSQQEIKEYKKYANIDVIDGWVYYPLHIIYPFRKEILKLYEWKNYYKVNDEPIKYMMVKILMNSLYGKMIQVNPDKTTGILFNPIYASLITGNTRIKLFKDSYPYRKNIVSFATDSIVFNKPVYIKSSSDLGAWEFSIDGEGVFIISGMYSIRSDNKKKNKYRGINKTIDFFDILGKYRDKDTLPFESVQVAQYGSVIRQRSKYELEDLNKFLYDYKTININSDKKRIWEDKFSCCGEALMNVIESKPVLLY